MGGTTFLCNEFWRQSLTGFLVRVWRYKPCQTRIKTATPASDIGRQVKKERKSLLFCEQKRSKKTLITFDRAVFSAIGPN
jgi:hypothetical protein